MFQLFKLWVLKHLAKAGPSVEAYRFQELADSGWVEVGRHTYGQPRVVCYAGSESRVRIGSFCSFSPGVIIITGGIHPPQWVSLYPFRIKWRLEGAYRDGMPTTRGEIVIGSDVWVGTDALILSGVTIGHGAVIAARAVVTRDIPPYAIAAGVPARVIRYRHSLEHIRRLLALAWWNWPDEQILEAVPWLSSDRVDEFLSRYEPRDFGESSTTDSEPTRSG